MEGEPIIVKDWVRERILGSGGFGIVTLWRNTETNELIAIKKGKPGIESMLTTKHRERWIQEVKMMQEIQHQNIVSFKPLPDILHIALEPFNKCQLPMLSMEYCTRGDLRETLNRSANCCGLPESACRDILADIKNAIEYLHERGITHRDLKPENIVLQDYSERPSKFIYKLTDLGFAKELDANSMNASLVGTLQYLAPEIFMSASYSNSVDYWSFGLLAFEIICGIRPFLPSYDLKPWLDKVKDKKSEYICIYETPTNQIEYSEQMFSTNHVTRTFKNEMEKWLKITLEWNPKKRGRINNEIVVFSMLDRILSKKIINVFSVFTYQFLSYEIDDSTLVSTLQGWIERDIQLPIDKQFLLNYDGEEVQSSDFCKDTFDEYINGPMLYVYQKGEILALIKDKITSPVVPKDIKWILSNPDQKMKHFHQKRIYAQGLYFVFQESRCYDTLLDACLFKLNYLIRKFTNSRAIMRKMSDDSIALYAQKEFSQSMLKFDLEKIKNSHKQFNSKWQDRLQQITSDIDKLKSATSRLIQRYESAYRRAAQLSTTYSDMYSKEQYKEHDLIKCFSEALDLYHIIKSRLKEQQRTSSENCREITKIIYNCFECRKRLLESQDLYKYMQQINDITKEYEQIVTVMLNAQEHLTKYQNQLWQVQCERQQDIWSFINENIDIRKPQFELGNPNIPNEKSTQIFKLQQPVQFIVGDPKLAKVNNVPSLTNKHSLDSQMDNLIETFPSLNMDTTNIINDNISLRNQLLQKTNEGLSQYQKLFNDYNCEFDFLKNQAN